MCGFTVVKEKKHFFFLLPTLKSLVSHPIHFIDVVSILVHFHGLVVVSEQL